MQSNAHNAHNVHTQGKCLHNIVRRMTHATDENKNSMHATQELKPYFNLIIM